MGKVFERGAKDLKLGKEKPNKHTHKTSRFLQDQGKVFFTPQKERKRTGNYQNCPPLKQQERKEGGREGRSKVDENNFQNRGKQNRSRKQHVTHQQKLNLECPPHPHTRKGSFCVTRQNYIKLTTSARFILIYHLGAICVHQQGSQMSQKDQAKQRRGFRLHQAQQSQ